MRDLPTQPVKNLYAQASKVTLKAELVAGDNCNYKKKAAKDPIKAFLAILEYQEWRGFLIVFELWNTVSFRF